MREICVLAVLVLLLPAFSAGDETAAPGKDEGSRSSIVLQSSVIGSAGGTGSNDSFIHKGTLAQPTPVGTAFSGDIRLEAGFWRRVRIATGVLDGVLPEMLRTRLFPNVPNPFNPLTTIRFELAERIPVTLVVYDIRGRAVRTLENGVLSPGRHEAVWDGRDDAGRSVGSGVYFSRMTAGGRASVHKMLLIR
ncbi:MAG: hypothetical protein JW958_10610 [Candidatus Eisenbacteria bacterium]|nr:hypothetical protein [Candidatus Eisenbacteria bacterium]